MRPGPAFTRLEDVGHVLAAAGLLGEGVAQGADGFVGAVDLTQGEDFLDGVRGLEAFSLESAGVEAEE